MSFPVQRGPYNYSIDLENTLTPTKNWGALMKPLSISAINLSKENVNFIELWMRIDAAPPDAKMYIDLGSISEDAMRRLVQIILFTPDVEAQRAFYEDGLGLHPVYAGPRWTSYRTAGATLALHPLDGGHRQEIELTFDSPDVGADVEHLRGWGIHAASDVQGQAYGTTVQFRDPAGNLIALRTGGDRPGDAGPVAVVEDAVIVVVKVAGIALTIQVRIELRGVRHEVAVVVHVRHIVTVVIVVRIHFSKDLPRGGLIVPCRRVQCQNQPQTPSNRAMTATHNLAPPYPPFPEG